MEKLTVKEYRLKYYTNHKDKWLTKVYCDVCCRDICKASWKKHLNCNTHTRLQHNKGLKETTLTISADSEDAS